MSNSIAGYARGDASLPTAPIDAAKFQDLKSSLLWSDEDDQRLQAAGNILGPQVDEILDLWYGFVGSHPHLVKYFAKPGGDPIPEYLDAVRARFGQWIHDTCNAPYDQSWLDYQFEIGRRHHTIGKNKTDGVDAEPIIPLRYLIAFIVPITATIRDFLANANESEEDVDAMYHAWFKAVTLTVTLWSEPYAGGDW